MSKSFFLLKLVQYFFNDCTLIYCIRRIQLKIAQLFFFASTIFPVKEMNKNNLIAKYPVI